MSISPSRLWSGRLPAGGQLTRASRRYRNTDREDILKGARHWATARRDRLQSTRPSLPGRRTATEPRSRSRIARTPVPALSGSSAPRCDGHSRRIRTRTSAWLRASPRAASVSHEEHRSCPGSFFLDVKHIYYLLGSNGILVSARRPAWPLLAGTELGTADLGTICISHLVEQIGRVRLRMPTARERLCLRPSSGPVAKVRGEHFTYASATR